MVTFRRHRGNKIHFWLEISNIILSHSKLTMLAMEKVLKQNHQLNPTLSILNIMAPVDPTLWVESRCPGGEYIRLRSRLSADEATLVSFYSLEFEEQNHKERNQRRNTCSEVWKWSCCVNDNNT